MCNATQKIIQLCELLPQCIMGNNTRYYKIRSYCCAASKMKTPDNKSKQNYHISPNTRKYFLISPLKRL